MHILTSLLADITKSSVDDQRLSGIIREYSLTPSLHPEES
jgi:hypothetical protein